MAKRWTYDAITVGQLTAIDLAKEGAQALVNASADVQAYRIYIYDDDKPAAEHAEAVYLPDIKRLGIAWGADATWADVDGLESGIEIWLNDDDEWEARN